MANAPNSLPAVDPAQHQKFLLAKRLSDMDKEHALIEKLLGKAKQTLACNVSPAEINALLLELSSYTLTHFREEEELMRSCRYPGLEAHIEEHTTLASYVRGLLDLRSKQQALQCAVEALELWLTTHIKIADKDFHGFLQR